MLQIGLKKIFFFFSFGGRVSSVGKADLEVMESEGTEDSYVNLPNN